MRPPEVENAPHTRRRHDDGGFTLIELIATIVVVGILAVAAVPSMSLIAGARTAAAVRLVARDLGYARERAIATGARTWVVFDVAGSSYSVLAESAASPGRAGATAINDPACPGKPYIQTIGLQDSAGVRITAALFDGGGEIGFDWMGKPFNSGQTALTANGTITLTGGAIVTVEAGTGLARVGP